MRMYSMYFVCKEYIGKVKGMGAKSKSTSSGTVYYLENWNANAMVLNEIAKIIPLQEKAKKIVMSIPTVFQNTDRFDLANNTKIMYESALSKLLISMQTIIDAYEVMGIKNADEKLNGFDVSLPKFKDLGEFAKCLDDLNFVITQCPYLQYGDAQIKYDSVDIGSTWLTFFVAGASGVALLSSLGKLVDMAVKIKSHVKTVRMQEEALRALELQNELAVEMTESFKKINRVVIDQCIGDLKKELGELKNGEEEGKAQKSIEKLAYWMDKGLQIYSSIDAPAEVKDLFPQQEDVSLLADDLQKLIEMKKE